MQFDATRQPAQQTRLGTEAFGFVPQYTSPEIGLVTRTSVPTRPKNSAAILRNLHFDGISWSAKDTGFRLFREAAFNQGAAFKDFGVHNLANKDSKFVFQCGTKVYEFDPFSDPLIQSEQHLFTAVSETVPCFRSYSPKYMIYTNGVNEPQKWDGTNWAALDNYPVTIGSDAYSKPSLCETFQGRLATAGFANLPYSVLLSEFGNPEGYSVVGSSPARAGVYTVPSQLGPITSLKTTRINSTSNEEILLIGCKNGLVYITGTSADDFVRIIASERFGIVNNQSWLKIDDSLVVLATDGLRYISSSTAFSNLQNTALSYHIHPIMSEINDSAAATEAFVLDNPQRLEAVFYFPRDGETKNRRGIIFNYARFAADNVAVLSEKIYPKDDGVFSTYSPACGITYKGLKLCGSYLGKMQRHWTGNLFDDIGIDYHYLTPLIEAPTPAQEASSRMFQILCEGYSQKFKATAFAYPATRYDSLRRTQMFSETISSNRDGGTIIGKWKLGESAFGGAAYDIFTFNPTGAGRAWEIELTGNTANGILNFVGIFSTLIGGGTRQ